MEIEQFKALDLKSWQDGYEEGKRHASKESYMRGFEAALRLMAKGYQDAKNYYDNLSKIYKTEK
jgi:hypothetical protein